MRAIAKRRGVEFTELTRLAETDASVDKEIDDFQRSLAKREGILLDSRLGFFFIPNSIKIFLRVDLNEGARRIIRQKREEEQYKDVEEAVREMVRRMGAEDARYKRYYGIENFRDEKNYDFVLDTTTLSIEQGLARVVGFIESRVQ